MINIYSSQILRYTFSGGSVLKWYLTYIAYTKKLIELKMIKKIILFNNFKEHSVMPCNLSLNKAHSTYMSINICHQFFNIVNKHTDFDTTSRKKEPKKGYKLLRAQHEKQNFCGIELGRKQKIEERKYPNLMLLENRNNLKNQNRGYRKNNFKKKHLHIMLKIGLFKVR